MIQGYSRCFAGMESVKFTGFLQQHKKLVRKVHVFNNCYIILYLDTTTRFFCPHLSAGRRGVSDFVSNLGEDGDEPTLTVELFAESSTGAAEQSSQKVLIASAELTVLQVVLQQPERQSQH